MKPLAEPEIIHAPERLMIGMSHELSLIQDTTFKLWSAFSPRSKEVEHRRNTYLFSVQDYQPLESFASFTPSTIFTKWAAVEVDNLEKIPEGMEWFKIPAGDYAIFKHKGSMETFSKNLMYIYLEWIPQSKYQIDDRPHFELMGDGYLGHNHPESEEDIWIPIIAKL